MKRETMEAAVDSWWAQCDRTPVNKGRYSIVKTRIEHHHRHLAGKLFEQARLNRRQQRALGEIETRMMLMRELSLSLKKAGFTEDFARICMKTGWNAGYASCEYLALFPDPKVRMMKSAEIGDKLSETWKAVPDVV